MFEFTGERLVPGLVDINLYHEHLSRYLYAVQFAQDKRVLDAGCGTGYGSEELSRVAESVLAVDVSGEAIEYAREHHSRPNVQFVQGLCTDVAAEDGSFDVVTAFEVIEHLSDWPQFLRECSRLLVPGGVLLVSTPNRSYYAETRETVGPNPFHVREFDYVEFGEELGKVFGHVEIVLQNHAEGMVFSAPELGESPTLHLRIDKAEPDEAHFFLAICSQSRRPPSIPFVYMPGSANILREREHHIAKLTGEVRQKSDWLAESNRELGEMVAKFHSLQEELEERNQWAQARHSEAEERAARVQALQEELADEQARAQTRITELEREIRAKNEWALESDSHLKICAEKLAEVEGTVVERTQWALRTQAELDAVHASRWHRLGQKLNLGPDSSH